MDKKPKFRLTNNGGLKIRRNTKRPRYVMPKNVDLELCMFRFGISLNEKHNIDERTKDLMISAFKTGWNTRVNVAKKGMKFTIEDANRLSEKSS